jgi:hypothetical protein
MVNKNDHMVKNQILMSSSDAHMLIDNVQECNYDEFSNDHTGM